MFTFLLLSFLYAGEFHLNQNEIQEQYRALEHKIKIYQEAIESKTSEEFTRLVQGEQACDHHCKKEVLTWRESLLLYLNAFKNRMPELYNSSKQGARKIYQEIWREAVTFDVYQRGMSDSKNYREHLKERYQKSQEAFLNTALTAKEITRQQSYRASSYVAKAGGQYNYLTAGSMVAVAGLTWLPWTAVTEGVEMLFLGPFHIFCHASQVLYLTLLQAVTKTVDRTASLLSFRPFEMSLSQKALLAYRSRRLLQWLNKQETKTNALWLVNKNVKQEKAKGFRFLIELKEAYENFQRAYANLEEYRYLDAINSKITWRENISMQYQYRRDLGRFRDGIQLLVLEKTYKGQFNPQDIQFMQSLLESTQASYKKHYSQHRELVCRSLFYISSWLH